MFQLLLGLGIGIVAGYYAAKRNSHCCHRSTLRGKLIMAVNFKNIDKVPFEVTGAVDAEGVAVEVPADVTFEWAVESTNGLDLGTVEVDAEDPKKGVFNAGVAGAEGMITVKATFADGKVLTGSSEQIILGASEAVSFMIKLGEPLA